MPENNQPAPAWTIENFLEIKNGELHVDGVSALQLAETYATPLFVFSEARIRRNINRLKAAQAEISVPLKICYAAKANSNMGILRAVKDAGSDIEVNSGGELWKVLKVGFRPAQIIFNGTSKTRGELEMAISAGIYAIQADSLYEIGLIERTAKDLKKRANVSLRIVPEIETGTHAGLKTAMNDSKFGMTLEDALAAFKKWQPGDETVNLCGIHLHVGSQTPDPAPYAEALAFLWEKLQLIFAETGHKLTHLNLGGGFPVNYLRDKAQANDFPASERRMFAADYAPADAIGSAWRAIERAAAETDSQALLKNIELLIEPGRSVIADAGICLTSVHNRKERETAGNGQRTADSEEISNIALRTPHSALENPKFQIPNPESRDVWLLTDAGFNILLSMETYKWYYHLISATRADAAHDTAYKLAGPLCDGGDVYFDIEGHGRLPDYRKLPADTKPGEVLALLNCGAYSIAQMFQYNGRFLPAVVLVRETGAVEQIRKRDVFEDLINNDLW